MAARPAFRVLAFVVALTFGWSVWTACAEAATATASAQMACCKDGELTCGAHGASADCCRTDAARRHDAVTGVKVDPVRSPCAVAVSAALPMSERPLVRARVDASTASPRVTPGPPPCIAFSSLLI